MGIFGWMRGRQVDRERVRLLEWAPAGEHAAGSIEISDVWNWFIFSSSPGRHTANPGAAVILLRSPFDNDGRGVKSGLVAEIQEFLTAFRP
jgi:hypothetical protein